MRQRIIITLLVLATFGSGMLTSSVFHIQFGNSNDLCDEGVWQYLEVRNEFKESFLYQDRISDDLLNKGSIKGMFEVAGDTYTRVRDVQNRNSPVSPEDISPTASVVFIDVIDGYTLALITIKSFDSNTNVVNEFEEIVGEIETMDPKGIILDLRGNLGGDLSYVTDIAGHWIGGKTVMIKEETRGKTTIVKSETSASLDRFHTVILIDGNTASASEVLACALRDHLSTHIIGEKSYGKGVGQYANTLPDGSEMRYTAFYWKSPKGISIHGTGIVPDQEVRSSYGYELPLTDDSDDSDLDGGPSVEVVIDYPLDRALDYLITVI